MLCYECYNERDVRQQYEREIGMALLVGAIFGLLLFFYWGFIFFRSLWRLLERDEDTRSDKEKWLDAVEELDVEWLEDVEEPDAE